MLTQRELAETQVTENEFSLSHRCVCVCVCVCVAGTRLRESWNGLTRLFGHLSFHRCFTASRPEVFTRIPAGSVKALPEAWDMDWYINTLTGNKTDLIQKRQQNGRKEHLYALQICLKSNNSNTNKTKYFDWHILRIVTGSWLFIFGPYKTLRIQAHYQRNDLRIFIPFPSSVCRCCWVAYLGRVLFHIEKDCTVLHMKSFRSFLRSYLFVTFLVEFIICGKFLIPFWCL